jgi:stage III sporulation protein SpoIIIAA
MGLIKMYKNMSNEDSRDEVELIIGDIQEALATAREAWESLQKITGYSDYQISQELGYGYVGENLATRVDALSEKIDEIMNDPDVPEDANGVIETVS